MKHTKITAIASRTNEKFPDEIHVFYMIISGSNVNLFPLTEGIDPITYDSMYDFLEEWSNVSKA